MTASRKALWLLVGVFVVYFVLTAPHLAANTFDGIWSLFANFFEALIVFVKALGGKG